MQFDLGKMESDECYKLLTQAVIPRPIAWVLTVNEGGATFNVAPFSYFSLICHNPGIVTLSIGLNDRDERKDTLRNFERTKKCVIHIAPTSMASVMTATAYSFDFGESEVAATGLKLHWDAGDIGTAEAYLPRIEGPKIAFYCSLLQTQHIGREQHTLILAEIDKLYCADECLHKTPHGSWRIDPKVVDPLLRMGGSLYGGLGQIIDSPRPLVKPTL